MRDFIEEYAINAVLNALVKALDESESDKSIGCVEVVKYRYFPAYRTLRVLVKYDVLNEDMTLFEKFSDEFKVDLNGVAELA